MTSSLSSFPSISPQVCLHRRAGRCNTGQDILAPAKPRAFKLALKTPGLFSHPKVTGNVFGLSLEAAKWRTQLSGQAQHVNSTQTCLIPGPTTVSSSNPLQGTVSFRRVSHGSAVQSTCQGVAWQRSTRDLMRGVCGR